MICVTVCGGCSNAAYFLLLFLCFAAQILAQAKTLLTQDVTDSLESAYGDLNEYLRSRIAAEVRNQKTSVGILTP